ncbi:HAD family hydrolase [Paenibacillus sp. FA6]|uniref:HAD family hydrolase n=1 Tax=Paenibacillus sp. FA6 TaxID=3413029 RepID=UPI003F65A8B1
MHIKAVIFDLDNTLMDRDMTFRKFTEQFVGEHLGHLDQHIQDEIVSDLKVRDADGYRNKQGFFAEMVEVLPWNNLVTASEIEAYYNKHYMTHACRMDYVEEVLAYCKYRGYRMGIMTNGPHYNQYRKMDVLQLRELFHTVIVSEDAGMKKPDQRIYQMALDKLQVSAENTVFVGDHPVNDIWGANQVGIRGIWLRRNHLWDDSLGMKPWKMIDQLNELMEII